MVESCLAVAGKQMRCCTAKDAPSSVLVDISTKRNSLDGTALRDCSVLGVSTKRNATWHEWWIAGKGSPFDKNQLWYMFIEKFLNHATWQPSQYNILRLFFSVPPNMIEWKTIQAGKHAHTIHLLYWTMPWRKSKRDSFEHKMVYDSLILLVTNNNWKTRYTGTDACTALIVFYHFNLERSWEELLTLSVHYSSWP